jgi:hypothetical protein
MPTINGTNAGETLNGTPANDTINGFAGNDTRVGFDGLDILNGGSGNDRFRINDQAEIVAGETYNGGLGFDTLALAGAGAIDISSTTLNSIEVLTAAGEVSADGGAGQQPGEVADRRGDTNHRRHRRPYRCYGLDDDVQPESRRQHVQFDRRYHGGLHGQWRHRGRCHHRRQWQRHAELPTICSAGATTTP